MAKVSLSGLDDIADTVYRLGADAEPLVERMLHAGSIAAKEVLKESVESNRHVRTGAMRDSIGYTLRRGDEAGMHSVVYPRGIETRTYTGRTKKTKSKKGEQYQVSNALKGFVLNYGSTARGISADRWFDHGANAAEPKVENEMRRVFEENIDKIMED